MATHLVGSLLVLVVVRSLGDVMPLENHLVLLEVVHGVDVLGDAHLHARIGSAVGVKVVPKGGNHLVLAPLTNRLCVVVPTANAAK